MGEVMPLTPEDVSNKRFTPVRLREGYDMGEVDQFLDEVEAELARLTKENEDLRGQAGRGPVRSGGAVAAFAAPAEPVVEEKAPEPEPEPAPEPRRWPAAAVAPLAGARPCGSRRCPRPPTPPPGCWRSRPATPTSSSRRPRTRPTGSSARPAPRPSGSSPRRRPRPTSSRPTPAPARRCSTPRPPSVASSCSATWSRSATSSTPRWRTSARSSASTAPG